MFICQSHTFSIPSGSLELELTRNFLKKHDSGSGHWNQILLCEAIHTSFTKTLSGGISQKAISSWSMRNSVLIPATFFLGLFTQDWRPRSHALLCEAAMGMQCFGYLLCCGGSHRAWPVRAVHFDGYKPSFQQWFPSYSLRSLSGCPRYQVSVIHSSWPEEQLVQSRKLCW